MPDELLTVEQAAERLQMHPVTIRRLLRENRLPGVKIGPQWCISTEALSEYMKGGRMPAPATEAAAKSAAVRAKQAAARKKTKG